MKALSKRKTTGGVDARNFLLKAAWLSVTQIIMTVLKY